MNAPYSIGDRTFKSEKWYDLLKLLLLLPMKGIEYIIDDQGEKTAVVINLDQWGKEWEAFYNLLLK